MDIQLPKGSAAAEAAVADLCKGIIQPECLQSGVLEGGVIHRQKTDRKNDGIRRSAAKCICRDAFHRKTVQSIGYRQHSARAVELALDIWLFCHYFERKSRFFLRILSALFSLLGMSILWNICKGPFAEDAWAMVGWNIFKYVTAFALGFWGVCFCFEISPSGALFTMICAFATQHISYRIYASILALTGLDYSAAAAVFTIISVTLAVYIAMYLLFVRRLKIHPERTIDNKSNIVVGGILIMFTIVLQFIVEVYLTNRSHPILFVLFSAYNLICCVFTLMIEQGLFRNSILANDKALPEHLLYKQEEQYHVTKANMDIINVKCHDMKHQISRMTSTTDPEAIRELEQIINIYDASLKTGNEILDVCLMEKKLLC